MATFKQVADNAKTHVLLNALDNLTDPVTIGVEPTEGSKFPVVTSGYWVTAWNDKKYPDPGDDPDMRVGLVSNRTGDTFIIDWLQTPTEHLPGRPALGLLMMAQHLIDLYTVVNASEATITSHIANTSNPHNVTKAQVGLGNADDTSDLNKPLSTAAIAALAKKQVRMYPTIGTIGSGADYECDGTADDVQFQQITDYCVANTIRRYIILRGAYEFAAVVKQRDPNLQPEGIEMGEVTISPAVGFGVSTTNQAADGFFSVFDDSGGDKPLSKIKFKNIIFDWKGRVPTSPLRAPSAIRYWPYQGSNSLDRVTTNGITANASVGTVPAGKAVLYGWLENTTTNSTHVTLATGQPVVTSGLDYTAATAFGNIPSNQLPSGSYLSPPILITTNDTYLGVISQNFTLTSLVLTNLLGSPVTFKLQAKLSTVTTNNPGDYTDITNEIVIPASSAVTVTSADLINSVLPAAADQLIRIDQGSTTWGSVSITVGAKVLTPVVGHITNSGTSLGVLLDDQDITKIVLTNNTASDTNVIIQGRRYLAPNGRDNTYGFIQHWLSLTGELTVPASGSLTIRRTDMIHSLPSNDPVDIRIVQGVTPWSGVDLSLTSVEKMFLLQDFYREITVPGETTQSFTGLLTDTSLGIFPQDTYVKSVTFTETAGHDWNGFLTDDDVSVIDRVFVPASGSVTINMYGNAAKANAVIGGGAITSATITNGGHDYSAAPIVQIQGDGTGATATATINGSGVVTAITITNGGSGYTQATITVVSLQRYNYVNPISGTQAFKIRAQQPPTTVPRLAKVWNSASINVSVTLGVRIGIRHEFMNDIFPQSIDRTLYLVNTDNNWNSTNMNLVLQKGSVVQDFELENIKCRGWQANGFGAIAINVGKALGSSNLSIGLMDRMKLKNVTFEDDYYPDPQNATQPTIGLHFNTTFIRNLDIDDITFENTHGKSIFWTGDSGDSLPITVVRARKNINVRRPKFRRTKRGVYNLSTATRLGDWYDETRIGYKNIVFDQPQFEEGSAAWTSDQSYKAEGATDNYSIAVGSSNTRSCIMFMNSDGVVINSPRFIRCRTCFDIGYTNPSGNEGKHIQINNIYAEDCWELGDIDGNWGTQYNGGQIIRLRNTGKINNYGTLNPTMWNNIYLEDCGYQTLTSIVNKCLFLVTRSGHQFRNLVVNYTQPYQIDYMFQEQDGAFDPNIPIVYDNIQFMGVAPAVRTFGLNQKQYHRITNNKGVLESTIQAVFTNSRDPIAPVNYLGREVSYGNVTAAGTLIDPMAPAQAGNSGKFLSTNGTDLAWVSGPTVGNAIEIVDPVNLLRSVSASGVASAAAWLDVLNAVASGTVQMTIKGSGNSSLLMKALGTGSIVLRAAANSTGAFLMQNSASSTFFAADATNSRVSVGGATPTSVLDVRGPIATAYVAKTGNYTLTATDSTVLFDTTAGSLTATLPTAVGCTGRMYRIKKLAGAGNTLNLATTSGQTIDGAAPGTVTDKILVQSDGANWTIV